ncbi:glycosyltransferase family 2 protein [Polymorphobacter sp.]|uniref:glycosyltransferase family 2 protein n=1 Tax=Polymorphobacter sp. TaxID=1909290 RepID=UPI003F71E5FB
MVESPSRSLLPAALRVAVLLPCYNEEAAIGVTVAAFQAALPEAKIYVYDNNSRDRTCAVAAAAGATVRTERTQGKGAVVRRMFADIEADIYVMADGDATYEAGAARRMVEQLYAENLDMVVGARVSDQTAAYRSGHRFGNAMLTGLLTQMFGRSFSDILTGYRVFSRRFVKSFPIRSAGFEIETEISVHALELVMPVAEVPTAYGARLENSVSKLSTYTDGFRILGTMINLYRYERPIEFFGIIAAFLLTISTVLAIPIIGTYLETGLVPRFPTAFLIVGLVILATLSVVTGLILDTVTKGRGEVKRLIYLQHAPPQG